MSSPMSIVTVGPRGLVVDQSTSRLTLNVIWGWKYGDFTARRFTALGAVPSRMTTVSQTFILRVGAVAFTLSL